MRLIYRGKVVANDADALETVFGADNVGRRALTVMCMWKLTRAPASRIQRPKPASGTARTAASPLDIIFARPTHRDRPAKSLSASASTAPSKPTPDEPVPSHTTTSTKLAATSWTTAAPSPPPCASSTRPSSPPCAAAAQSTRPHGRHPPPTPDAAADCTSIRPARRSSTYARCRHTNTDTADRRSSHASTGRASTWIRRASSTEWQDGTARGGWTKWRTLVRHIQRLYSKHTAAAWTANLSTACSVCCSTPPIWFARARWSECASQLALTATSRNSAGGCS